MYKLSLNPPPETLKWLRNIPANDRMKALMEMKPKDLRALCNSSKQMRNWCVSEQPICKRIFPSLEIAMKHIFDAKYTYALRDPMNNIITIGVYGAPETKFTHAVRKSRVATPQVIKELYALRDKIESMLPKKMITDYRITYVESVSKRKGRGMYSFLTNSIYEPLPMEVREKLKTFEENIQKHLNKQKSKLSEWNLSLKMLEARSVCK